MRDGRMREREPQQTLVAESVTETGLEFGEGRHELFGKHPTANIQSFYDILVGRWNHLLTTFVLGKNHARNTTTGIIGGK
jgi:hypothetical protein